MKLLILSTKLPYPAKDGGAIATLSLAQDLASQGIEVSILCINTRKHFFPLNKIPTHITESIQFYGVEKNTAIRPIPLILNLIFSRQPYIAVRYNSKAFRLKLKTLLSQEKYDIIQLEGPYLKSYISLIRKHSSAKISFRAHNLEHEIWNRRSVNEKIWITKIYYTILAKRIKKLELSLLSRVDLLVSISSRDNDKFLSLVPQIKNICIPTGINIAEYPLPKTENFNDICFIGALDWAPNQEGLLWFINEVLPHLEEKKLELHIAGRNAPSDFLSKLSHPFIIYHGEVEDAKSYIGKYAIMVVPLLSASGIRIKILEGMALGRCIITSSIGAEGISAKDGEDLLIGNDGKTFANQIIKVLNDKNILTSISKNARKLVEEKFDNFALSSNLSDIYKSIT